MQEMKRLLDAFFEIQRRLTSLFFVRAVLSGFFLDQAAEVGLAVGTEGLQ